MLVPRTGDEDPGVVEDLAVCRTSLRQTLKRFTPFQKWTPYLARRTLRRRCSNATVSVTTSGVVAIVVSSLSTQRQGNHQLDGVLEELAHSKATCRTSLEGSTGDQSIKRMGSGPAVGEAWRTQGCVSYTGPRLQRAADVDWRGELDWLDAALS